MCSTNVPNRRRSTLPTRKAGSSVRVAGAIQRVYNVICIVVNPEGEIVANPIARRGGPGGRLGEDREQRRERLRSRLPGDPGARPGGDRGDRLPTQRDGPQPPVRT